jgi:hypothetical protein
MNTCSGRVRMKWLAGLLAPIAFLTPASAFAIFPPVIQQPTVTITSVKSDPVVHVQGGGGTPVVIPPTVNTPEPATIVTGLISLALGGYFLRKKKAVQKKLEATVAFQS